MIKRNPNITIFSGISGIDKRAFIKNFIKKSGKSKNVLVIDFEKELLNESRNPPVSAPDMPTFLNSDDPTLKLRSIETNYSWIAKQMDKRSEKTTDIFLNMHLSYFKNSEFYPPFIPLYFKEILTKFPDSEIRIITLIDDVFAIWKKIKDRECDGFLNTQLTLREILAWRSLESLHAEALKEHISILEEGSRRVSHFVVSIRHPFNTFNNLIFQDNPQRIYLSYPISSTRNDPKDIRDINNFRKIMHKFAEKHGTAIFDPVAIDELAMKTALDEAISKNKINTLVTLKKDHRWFLDPLEPLTDDVKYPIVIPRTQIEEALKDINNQIASRDYTLVDSSLFLAVYRPVYKGQLSRGVDAEIKRANNHMKKVIMYHPEEDQKLSPKATSTHPFGNKVDQFEVKKDFVDYILKVIKQQKKRDKS
ncbi:MAG: hypothetical protein RI100_07950 [Nitrosarchaeum sp.]|jgi:hypothetical protein|uniref:hypothetical protein n=1 Tax=Nitrosarchaeum sp. TaxID=2026886 RepID=UPI002DE90CB3|nr:hypothetical protein [Nitrosarchaeum sp.]